MGTTKKYIAALVIISLMASSFLLLAAPDNEKDTIQTIPTSTQRRNTPTQITIKEWGVTVPLRKDYGYINYDHQSTGFQSTGGIQRQQQVVESAVYFQVSYIDEGAVGCTLNLTIYRSNDTPTVGKNARQIGDYYYSVSRGNLVGSSCDEENENVMLALELVEDFNINDLRASTAAEIRDR